MTKVKMITNNIVENTKTQKILFNILISSTLVLCLVYGYLIVSMTFNIIARKSLEKNLATLTNEVNDLNITYINNINEINKEYALSKGFVDAPQNIFVSRNINHIAIR
jgi:hypothetical protein